MAFRDHLGAASIEDEEISLSHGMLNHSQASGHAMTVFTNISECPGHRAAVNMLTRDRLCAAIGIEPEEYIDTLGWAMSNPSAPEMVQPEDAPCMENQQAEVNLEQTVGDIPQPALLLPRITEYETYRFTVNF